MIFFTKKIIIFYLCGPAGQPASPHIGCGLCGTGLSRSTNEISEPAPRFLLAGCKPVRILKKITYKNVNVIMIKYVTVLDRTFRAQ